MLLYDTKNAKFTYESDHKLLYQKWIGFTTFEAFKAAIDELMSIAHKKKIEYVISDATEFAILKKESTDYAASVMPQLFWLGMKKMAFVLPKDVFIEMSLNNFKEESNSKATSSPEGIAHFDNVDAARKWLFE